MSLACERLGQLDPVEAAERLSGLPGFVWLDSASATHASASFSYICINPVSRFAWQAGQEPADFAIAFRAWLRRFRAERAAGGPPFQGGAVGYLSYDASGLFMPRFRSRHAPASGTVAEFGYYDTIIAFDHATGEAYLCSAGLEAKGGGPDPALARQKTDDVLSVLNTGAIIAPAPASGAGWQPLAGQPPYAELVRAAQAEILDGEIYQANLARLWTGEPKHRAEAFADFLRLKRVTHAPCAAFGAFDARTIASFSPERLVSMTAGGRVRAEPIKGTIRRSPDQAEDERLCGELMASAKDRAENIMIVDLLRNDLSRVCDPRSVDVTRLCDVESLPNLHHLVSTIEGQLGDGLDAVDLLAAVFPGGSITGCPKLRAMEIIDGLEPQSRGAFCGSLGYIGHDGACDFNIMIRTIEHLRDVSRYWSGAGITLRSDPAAETGEIELKAERILAPAPGSVDAT